MRIKPTWILGLIVAAAALNALHPTSAAAFFDFPVRERGAPEIGADAIGGAIAIVAGGLAMLRDRIRRS